MTFKQVIRLIWGVFFWLAVILFVHKEFGFFEWIDDCLDWLDRVG